VADKNFKVKSGLQVPSLTTAGPVTTDSAGNVTSSATLPISQGGTGQTTAGNALNAFLPLQTSQDNKFLQTNGVTTQWTTPQQHTATDGVLGSRVYSGTVTPSSPVIGDLWIDQTTGNGIQLVRWRKTVASATTTVTGLDDNNLTLSYTSGNEQVYINGVLITRGQDYTATNGTSVVLVEAVAAGDTVEIFGNPLFSVTDTYTQAQAESRYVSYNNLNAAGKNMIINGGFDSWQRGASITAASHNTYTADQWININDSIGNINVSRQDISSQELGLRYAARFEKTSGASNRFVFINMSEGALSCVGKQVTLSFWIRKGPNLTSGVSVSIGTRAAKYGTVYNDGSFGILNSQISSSTFTRFTSTFNITSATASNNADLFELEFSAVQAGSTGSYFDIAGVQLEVGNIATPFSRAGGTIAGELASCQRYFERIGQNSYSPYGTGLCGSTTTARVNVTCQPKRTPVSVSYGATNTFEVWNAAFAGVAVTGISSVAVNRSQVNIGITVASGLVAGNSTILIDGSTGNSFIDFSAEL
jgi:hypothetical protein